MKLAFDKFVQHVKAGLIKIEDVFDGVEIVYGSANQRGTLVKGGCIRVGDRVFNLNTDTIKKFILSPRVQVPATSDSVSEEITIHKTSAMGSSEQSLLDYLKMMGTGPFVYDGEKIHDGIKIDGKMIKEISQQIDVPLSTVLNIVKMYIGIPVEMEVVTEQAQGKGLGTEGKGAGALNDLENQSDTKGQEAGASTETLIRESRQDQGSNLGASSQVGSILRMTDRASAEVTQGPAKGSQDGDPSGD